MDIEKINAILRLHYGVDPESLDLDTWSRLFQEWTYVQRINRKAEADNLKGVLQDFFIPIINKLYGEPSKKGRK